MLQDLLAQPMVQWVGTPPIHMEITGSLEKENGPNQGLLVMFHVHRDVWSCSMLIGRGPPKVTRLKVPSAQRRAEDNKRFLLVSGPVAVAKKGTLSLSFPRLALLNVCRFFVSKYARNVSPLCDTVGVDFEG